MSESGRVGRGGRVDGLGFLEWEVVVLKKWEKEEGSAVGVGAIWFWRRSVYVKALKAVAWLRLIVKTDTTALLFPRKRCHAAGWM